MTLAVVITVGILGTLLFSYMAYRNWVSSVPTQRTRPARTPTAVQPLASTPPRRRRRWLPPKWAVITVFIALLMWGPPSYFAWLDHSKQGAGLKGRPTASYFSILTRDVMLKVVAWHESRGRQFNKDGTVVINKNRNGSVDRGMYQINSQHDDLARRLGHNPLTEEGNKAMADYLFAKNGLRDWDASRHNWEPELLALAKGIPLPELATKSAVTRAEAVTLRREKPATIKVPAGRRMVFEGFEGEVPKNCWRERGYRNKRSHPFTATPSTTEIQKGKLKFVCVW